MEMITIEAPSLGDRSYVVLTAGQAAAIDPQRDIDRIEAVLRERGVRLTHVFETHIHNDYVTGGLELARRAGAAYVVAADEEVSFERVGARDGDELVVGELTVRALHTPGHTPHHLSYVLLEDGRPVATFTGGSMLFGTVGRTDLIADDTTEAPTLAPVNRRGPAPVDLSPPEPVDPAEIRRRIHVGEWVVDLRDRTAFARGHLAGTINVEVGDSFATYLGWTLRWETPVTLVGDSAAEVAEGEVWVHCASGYRASIAASILDRAGRRVVHVDDDWAGATKYDPLGVTGAH